MQVVRQVVNLKFKDMLSSLTSIVCLSILYFEISIVSGVQTMKNFTMNTPLYSIHLNADDRMIYVGGRNMLLQLDWDLNLINTVEKIDSAYCESGGKCPGGSPPPNEIKVVDISNRMNRLFVCGTARHGACSLHSPRNISVYSDLIGQSTGPYVGGKKSSLVYLSVFSDDFVKDIVYVFHEYDGRDARFSPFALSARHLNETDHTLNYLMEKSNDTGQLRVSGLDIHPKHKPNYYMSFVYTFKHGNYLFLLMNQLKSLSNETDVRIRLARINYGRYKECLSYIETEIFCVKGDIHFNKAMTASFDNNNLYISAMMLQASSRENIDVHKGSVIFKFPISTLNDHFKEGFTVCYSGKDGQVPEWSTETTVKCQQEQIDVIEEDMCVSPANPAIRWDANRGVPAGILLKHLESTVVTAIKPFKNGANNLLLVGDDEGNIRKFDINSDNAREYLKVNIGDGPVRDDLVQDTDGDFFVLAGEKIFKFPVTSCSLHADCESCVTSGDPLGCGWCDGTCTSAAECAAGNRVWRSGSDATCPPTIFSISPLSGPTNGGTLLTVTGKNFGTKIEQIKVSIDKVECEVKDLSEQLNRIVCKTQASLNDMTNVVRVAVMDNTVPLHRLFKVGGHDESKDSFSYKTPSITGFKPTRGPQSGGTVITITGNNLNIGSERKIFISSYQCVINNASISATGLQCTTEKWSQSTSRRRRTTNSALFSGPLSVSIDELVLTSISTFSYHPDPQILDVFPQKSIISGGIPITVKGSHLDASETPLMTGETTDNKPLVVNTTCSVNDEGTEMVCPSMNVRNVIDRKRAQVYIAFIYDGTKWPKIHESYSVFKYTVDPEFFPFPNYIYKFEVDDSEMKFRGLNILQAELKDYQVTVGTKVCVVIEIEIYKLKCRPDASGIDVGGRTQYVQIKVGNLDFNSSKLGWVHLVPDESDFDKLSPVVKVIIPASVIFFLLTVFVVVFCHIRMMKRRECRTNRKFIADCKARALQNLNSDGKFDSPPGEEKFPLGEFPS